MFRHIGMSVLVLVIALGVGCNRDGGKKPTPPTPAPTDPTPAPTTLLQQLLDSHNAERTKAGVTSLKLNDKLTQAAQKHADWMAATKAMSHTGANGSSFADRIRATGYPMLMGGENIAAGYPDVQRVMAGWKNSPGHYRNITNSGFREVGFGMKDRYWCTVLAAPARSDNPLFIVEEQPDGIEYKEP